MENTKDFELLKKWFCACVCVFIEDAIPNIRADAACAAPAGAALEVRCATTDRVPTHRTSHRVQYEMNGEVARVHC